MYVRRQMCRDDDRYRSAKPPLIVPFQVQAVARQRTLQNRIQFVRIYIDFVISQSYCTVYFIILCDS